MPLWGKSGGPDLNPSKCVSHSLDVKKAWGWGKLVLQSRPLFGGQMLKLLTVVTGWGLEGCAGGKED